MSVKMSNSNVSQREEVWCTLLKRCASVRGNEVNYRCVMEGMDWHYTVHLWPQCHKYSQMIKRNYDYGYRGWTSENRERL